MLLNCSHFVTLETSGRFSDVSRRYRKRPMVWNVLKWRFLRKQPPEVFYKKGVRKIHRKVPDHSFFFDEVASVKRATSSKKKTLEYLRVTTSVSFPNDIIHQWKFSPNMYAISHLCLFYWHCFKSIQWKIVKNN